MSFIKLIRNQDILFALSIKEWLGHDFLIINFRSKSLQTHLRKIRLKSFCLTSTLLQICSVTA